MSEEADFEEESGFQFNWDVLLEASLKRASGATIDCFFSRVYLE